MTLVELLDLANAGYSDGFLSQYYDETGKFNEEASGDSLARFIVAEIIETYDPEATTATQLAEARRVVERGLGDIRAVFEQLHAACEAEEEEPGSWRNAMS